MIIFHSPKASKMLLLKTIFDKFLKIRSTSQISADLQNIRSPKKQYQNSQICGLLPSELIWAFFFASNPIIPLPDFSCRKLSFFIHSPPGVGFGLNTGPAVAGLLGADTHMQFTVIGRGGGVLLDKTRASLRYENDRKYIEIVYRNASKFSYCLDHSEALGKTHILYIVQDYSYDYGQICHDEDAAEATGLDFFLFCCYQPSCVVSQQSLLTPPQAIQSMWPRDCVRRRTVEKCWWPGPRCRSWGHGVGVCFFFFFFFFGGGGDCVSISIYTVCIYTKCIMSISSVVGRMCYCLLYNCGS